MPPPPPPPRRGELRKPIPTPPKQSEGSEIRVDLIDAPIKCQICSKMGVNGKCINCNKFICGHCMLIHKQIPELQSHNVIDIAPSGSGEDLSGASPNIMCTDTTCEKHNSLAINNWCGQCDWPICKLCKKEHGGHEYTFVNIGAMSGESLSFLRGICFEKVKKLLEPKDKVKLSLEKLSSTSKLFLENTMKDRKGKQKEVIDFVSSFVAQDEQIMENAVSNFDKSLLKRLKDELKEMQSSLEQGVVDLTSAATRTDIGNILRTLVKHSTQFDKLEPLLEKTSLAIKQMENTELLDYKFKEMIQNIEFCLSETFNSPIGPKCCPRYPLQWPSKPKVTVDLSHIFDDSIGQFLNCLYEGGLIFTCPSAGIFGKINLNGRVTKLDIASHLLQNAKAYHLFNHIFACISEETVKITKDDDGNMMRLFEMSSTEGEYKIQAACGVHGDGNIVALIMGDVKTSRSQIKVIQMDKELSYISSFEVKSKAMKFDNTLLQAGPGQTVLCSTFKTTTIYKYDLQGNLLATYIDSSELTYGLNNFCVDPLGYVYALFSSGLICFDPNGSILQRPDIQVPLQDIRTIFHNVVLHGEDIIVIASEEDKSDGDPYMMFVFKN